MHKIKSVITKKIVIARWELNIIVFGAILLGFVIGNYFIIKDIIPKIFAATSPWTQTDWSGGAATGTVTGTVTTYESETDIATEPNLGELSVRETTGWSGNYSDWMYRKKIEFNNTDANLGTASENLIDFPVLVKLDQTTDIDYSKTQDLGQDIRFTDTDGSPLSYEIEKWNESGSSYIWVKVPQIDQNTDTDSIYLYYGNGSASDAQSPTDVWDSSFLGVWHGDDASATTLEDSSQFNKDATKQSNNQPAYSANGLIAGAQNYSQGLSRSATTITDALTDFTVEVWFKDDGIVTQYERLADKSYASCFWFGRNGSTPNSWGGGVREQTAPYGVFVTLSDGQWHQISSIRSGTTHYVYGDGGTVNSSNTVSGTACDATTFSIGAWGNGSSSTQWFGGTIDEVRLSNIARTQAWIAASYKSGTDTFSSFSSEEVKLASTASLTSNIFDAEFPADWGSLSYTTSGTGTVTVKVRSDSNSDMGGAADWDSCTNISSGTDLTSTECVDDQDQYIQYQVILEPDEASSPVFEEISIDFSASDQTPPITNGGNLRMYVSDGGRQVPSTDLDGNWNSSITPFFNWDDGADNDEGSGVKGYCLYLGTSESGNPATSGGILQNSPVSTSGTNCGFIAPNSEIDFSLGSYLSSPMVSGETYYLNLKIVDIANNIYAGSSEQFKFRHDSTLPTNVSYISAPSINFGSVNDMSFNWPGSGGSASNDANSGLLGWQYQINSTSDEGWKGTDTETELQVAYIPFSGSTFDHVLTEGDDGDSIVVGNNIVYFRTIDNAGNPSSAGTYRTASLSYGGAAPTFSTACDLNTGITITPSSSDANSFGLSWDAANATGENTVAGYYYMVNTNPPPVLATLQSNSTLYVPTLTSTSVSTRALSGAVKGSNYIYVVAIDNNDNYSQSNCIKGTFTLNSTLPDAPRNLTAADSSIKSEEIWKASLTWDAPAYQGTGSITYKIQRSTDNSSWSDIGTTTGNSYTDTVETSETYYYRVGAYDNTVSSQNSPTFTSSVAVLPKGTYDEAPELSSGPIVTNITTKRATVSWSTSRTSDSKVSFGKNSGDYFDEEPSKSEQVTSHEIQLTNLDPGQKYYYKTKWTDEDGNTGISTEKTFTTDPAPEVFDVQTTNISISSATVSFTVSNTSALTLVYGPSTAYGGTQSTATSTDETTYSINLTGLLDNTEYHYKLIMEDTENEEYESDDYTFTTLPRPQISNVAIQQIKNAAQPTVLVTWNTNTEVSSIVTYYPSGDPGQSKDEVNIALISGEHKAILRSLSSTTGYSLIVSGRDVVGNEARSDVQSFTTATDTRPPLISNLKVEGSTLKGTNKNEAQVQLIVTWDTDEPSTAQVEFGEGTGTTYSQKTQEDNNLTTNHLVLISGLTPSKVYHLRAISKDSAGNITESIDTVTITPKATENALDLVVTSLSSVFSFIGIIN